MERILFICLISVFMISCASIPQKLSSVPIPANYQEMGESSCAKCGFLLFDVIPIAFKGIPQKAYNCAVTAKNGDEIINATITNRWFYGFIGTGYCTQISGTVIKLKDKAETVKQNSEEIK